MQFGKTGGLNVYEKRIVRGFLNEHWRAQDIVTEINSFRPCTVNVGRIYDVRDDPNQKAAAKKELEEYRAFKRSFDAQTGLSPFLDERLVKSREAMLLAVQVFNSPAISFRAETFSVLAVIAWTYLAIEFADENDLPTKRQNGSAISLSDFLKHNGCPFSEGIKNNLKAVISIRDSVEHNLVGPRIGDWLGVFQACCVNYEKKIVELFGERLSLSKELAFSLQFSGISIEQSETMLRSELPQAIKAINSEVFDGLTEDQQSDQEFQFSVVYTTVAGSKSSSFVRFISPDSAEGEDVKNVLVKHKPSALTHPFLAGQVVIEVNNRTGGQFNQHMHTQAWKSKKVRPVGGVERPEKTNLDYCYYNPTYKSYSYNERWVQLLCKEVGC
ncbi:DUF3644 domain-containing protein [Aliiroseovarius lamellibrachiae]|uniref:DUF3644 domain-containing protein n=1 Tax=Aliiroseovarius lamellibrachiae TaxID=1924933 RepID=UPI001BE09048|nr:DUF3644 domain-containing protein [Aliiroseovarius lamellibrachiae]MBT2131310.1 DUF3644 domain-containing protein [Aliiroseovarius lamellibrachiae]